MDRGSRLLVDPDVSHRTVRPASSALPEEAGMTEIVVDVSASAVQEAQAVRTAPR